MAISRLPPGNKDNDDQLRETWVYVGRNQSHSRAITGLEFGSREDGRISLVSVGEDKCLVEYSLPDSQQARMNGVFYKTRSDRRTSSLGFKLDHQ